MSPEPSSLLFTLFLFRSFFCIRKAGSEQYLKHGDTDAQRAGGRTQ